MSHARMLAFGVALVLPLLTLATPSRPAEPFTPTDAQLDAVARVIGKRYLRALPADSLHAAARALFDHTLDPYSSYLDSVSYRELLSAVHGSFGGIGVRLRADSTDSSIRVVSPFRGSPAFRAGIRPEDRLISIDGHPVAGLSLDGVSGRLRGKEGSRVVVTVRRAGAAADLSFPMTRRAIAPHSVRSYRLSGTDAERFLVDRDAKIAYLRCSYLSLTTPDDLSSALESCERSGARALILDLRENTGGSFSGAVRSADLFVDEGPLIAERVRGRKDEVALAKRGAAWRRPVLMLVDDRTISAGEVLACALQDRAGAMVLGERTAGKGVGQQLITVKALPGALRLTTFQYIRPSGRPVERRFPGIDSRLGGVWPDSALVDAWDPSARDAWSNEVWMRDALANDAFAPPDTAALVPDAMLDHAVERLRRKLAGD